MYYLLISHTISVDTRLPHIVLQESAKPETEDESATKKIGGLRSIHYTTMERTTVKEGAVISALDS